MAQRGPRKTIPRELTSKAVIPMHPKVQMELKIASMRDGYQSLALWMHDHFCETLGITDIHIEPPKAESISTR